MKYFPRMIKKFFLGLGYEIRKLQSQDINTATKQLDPFQEQKKLANLLENPVQTIFDVGANKGQSARRYLSLFPSAQIFCFEPFPDSLTELNNLFGDNDRILILNKAVAEKSGRSNFYLNEFDQTNSLLPRPESGRRYYPKSAGAKGVLEVDTISLDEFVVENGIQKIDILKFDIQGGELNALRGASDILKSGMVSLLYTEIMFVPHYEGNPLFNEIWSFLESYGYSLFNIFDLHTATNGQIRYGDALFVSETVRRNIIDKLPEEP